MATFKKAATLFLALLFVAGASMAQKKKEKKEVEKDPGKFKKMQDYYDAGKYADCIWKGDKWSDDEKYNKDPELFMLMSMSYLGIFKDPESWPLKKYPDFKNPLHDAMSNYAKFKKKDKTGEVLAENKAFADELRGAVIMQAMDLHEKKDVSHLGTLSRDIVKVYDKDEVMMLLGGSYLYMTNAVSEGIKPVDSAMVSLKKKVGTQPKYTDEDQKALTEGFIVYTDYLLAKKDAAKAKEVMVVANQISVLNDKLKTQNEKVEKAAPAK